MKSLSLASAIAVLFAIASPAIATTLDLTTEGSSGTINGALFQQTDPIPTGTGFIDSFVRMQTNQPIDASTVSAPDSFGMVQIDLDLTTSGVGGIIYTGYIVDANHLYLVENSITTADVFYGVTGGIAYSQGGTAGGFSASTIAGSSFVFGTNGQDTTGFLQMAGS